MKKLIALIAVLGLGPVAQAADGADFSHSGDFRVIYNNDMNADGNDGGGDSSDQSVTQRLRWGTTVRAGEKLSGHFTLVHGAGWGSNWATDQYPAGTGGWNDANDNGTVDAGEMAENSTSNLLLVNEAYMNWMASDAWMFRFGRGSFTMADGRFVSTNDWEQVQKAFDGALATWDHEVARTNFFAVQGADFTEANAQGNFFGFSADFKSLPSFLKSANLHLVQVKRDDTADLGNVGKESVMKVGAVLTGEVAGADWRVNYEMEDGETAISTGNATADDTSTSMMDVEVGYAVPAAMNARFYVGYHTDTGTADSVTAGDDETYDGFHYDSHNNAGLMDIVEWGNLTYTRVGATFAPADDITVAAEYLMFSQTEKDDSTNGVNSVAADNEDDLGTELDLTVTKKYTNNFNIAASYRMFSWGDEFEGVREDDASQLYIEGKLTF